MKIDVRRRMIGTIPVLEVVDHEKLYDPLPLIVYYHGWQTAKELVLTQGRKLATQGFRVVLPDAMNHGERKTTRSEIPSLTFWQSIHTNLFEFEFILKYFERLHVTNGIVGVGGVSMGGMTTCALLTHHPEINAAACVMGSPDLLAYRELLKEHAKMKKIYMPKDYNDLLSWMESYDLVKNIDTLEDRPLFIWHGTEDEKIPFSQVKKFVENHPHHSIVFQYENERHLVKTETMDEVTHFFVNTLFSKD